MSLDLKAPLQEKNGLHAIVGGENYGQGSSREHAALAPRYLGLQMVLAKSFARIHWQNLVNFGILPLTFENPDDYQKINQGEVLKLEDLIDHLQEGKKLSVKVENKHLTIPVKHRLSPRQIEVLIDGGLINWLKKDKVLKKTNDQ